MPTYHLRFVALGRLRRSAFCISSAFLTVTLTCHSTLTISLTKLRNDILPYTWLNPPAGSQPQEKSANLTTVPGTEKSVNYVALKAGRIERKSNYMEKVLRKTSLCQISRVYQNLQMTTRMHLAASMMG